MQRQEIEHEIEVLRALDSPDLAPCIELFQRLLRLTDLVEHIERLRREEG
jgi:hypothetical protein